MNGNLEFRPGNIGTATIMVIYFNCSRERSLDGTCNNVKNPTWGASYTTYGHILPALFEDGRI